MTVALGLSWLSIAVAVTDLAVGGGVGAAEDYNVGIVKPDSLKNSPKLRIYMRQRPASTTVTFAPISQPGTLATAFATSESLPTPEGSMRMRSG